MRRLETLDVVDGQRVVGVGLDLQRRNGVDRVVGEVLAGDPGDRRVEVRPRVLAARKVVPVPARTACVVRRHLLDP